MKQNASPKNILYVENGIGYGGAIICLRHLARSVDRTRFRPLVITGRTSDEYRKIADDALWKHIPDRHFNVVEYQQWLSTQTWPDFLPGLRFLAQQILARLDDLCNFLPFFLRLLWTAWRFKADLIHANNEPLCNRAALLVGKCLRIPTICHIRGTLCGSHLMKWAYTLPDHFISVSNWIADAVISKMNIDPAKITVVYDGIPLENLNLHASGRTFRTQYQIPDDAFVVGLVGLLIPWKGQEIFLDATKLLKDKIPNLRMAIVGGTPDDCVEYEKRLRRRVQEEGLDNIVIFTGHISEMEAAYNGLDIVVSASTDPEPLGTVVIESMALSRPLIVPDHGGGAEMVEHNRTGLQFKNRDPNSLARSILDLFNNPELANTLGKNAREKALDLFSVTRHTETIEKIYSHFLPNNSDENELTKRIQNPDDCRF